jgi:hypothetical protein
MRGEAAPELAGAGVASKLALADGEAAGSGGAIDEGVG